MADTKEADSKRKEPAKKGLHGWKAAAAVFGCGTLAAFGVFGVIVSALSLFISTASSGISSASDDSAPIPVQTGKPREEVDPGALAFCDGYFPHMSDVDVDELISSEHEDDANSSDYDLEEPRKASGECSFTATPQFGATTRWYFDFEYEAFVYDPDQNEKDLAYDLFSSELGEVEATFGDVESRSQRGWADVVESFYGDDMDGVSRYVAVAQTKSVVYKIVFSGDPTGVESGHVPEFDFERQADQLGERLHKMYFDAIPE